jgi:hypothetical protein
MTEVLTKLRRNASNNLPVNAAQLLRQRHDLYIVVVRSSLKPTHALVQFEEGLIYPLSQRVLTYALQIRYNCLINVLCAISVGPLLFSCGCSSLSNGGEGSERELMLSH